MRIFVSTQSLVLAVIFMAAFSTSFAQLSPPGLGNAKTASWFAFGVKQSLDTTGHKVSTTYVGLGRKSEPYESNPTSKMGIFVINEEISNRYAEHWEYSYALSYRRSNLYESDASYENLNPAIEQEFRVYGRYSYLTGTDRVKWKNTFRQEFRKFYNPNFSNTDENFQLRTRLKTQLNVSLGNGKMHQIIGSAEALFAISKENYPQSEWTKFKYKEARLGLYYSLSPREIPFTFDLGYMRNIIGQSNVVGVDYISLDVVWKDPFGK